MFTEACTCGIVRHSEPIPILKWTSYKIHLREIFFNEGFVSELQVGFFILLIFSGYACDAIIIDIGFVNVGDLNESWQDPLFYREKNIQFYNVSFGKVKFQIDMTKTEALKDLAQIFSSACWLQT